MRINNTFFEPDGTPGYVDWQGAMKGHWAYDVSYFVGGALAILVAVRPGIPFLARQFGIAPVFGWFLTSGVLVTFFFFAAIIAARRSAGARRAT